MRVSEWLDKHADDIVTVPPTAALTDVMSRLLDEPCLRDIYVAADDGRLLGHISHRRLAEHVLAEARPTHTRRQLMERVAGGTAADFMNSVLATASPEESLDEVLARQLEMELEDMPVVDDEGQVIGAINLTHVLQNFMSAARRDS